MFEKVIAKAVSALKKHDIPYMIIGGQAVLLYGTPRLTKDIDITLGVGIDKLDIVMGAIKKAGFKIIPEKPEAFVMKTFVLPAEDKKLRIRVDLIFSFTPYERQAVSRARDKVVAGIKVKFASKEDIVIHKIFSGRARDIEDVRAILIKNPDCNESYIKKWLSEFDKAAGGKKFSRIFRSLVKELK